MARKLPVDLGKDGKLGVVDLAVDVHGDQFLRRFGNLLEELAHARGLAGPRQPLADGVQRRPSPEPGPDLERELAHLVLPELELLGHVVELEDLGILKKRLVPHQQVLGHDAPVRRGTRAANI